MKVKRSANNPYHGFQDTLKDTIEEFDGKYKEIVKYCPSLFALLCKILNDKATDWNTKLMIDAALAYFVLPDDIIPDNEEAGDVDDLFIVCHVLKDIKDNVSSELIEANWEGKGNIIQLIDELYEKSNHIVKDQTSAILRRVGLQKYQALGIAEYSGTYPKKIAKIANEKRELLGLLAFLVRHIYGINPRGQKIQQIREFLEKHGDFDEINRLIELSKVNHQYKPSTKKQTETNNHLDIESKLRAARMKALIEENLEKEEENEFS